MNYEDDIRIDDGALDVEWLEQASLMMRYARHLAEMNRELDLAKEHLDIVKAELDKEIREDPEKFGIGKITEAVVTNTILQQKKYQSQYHEYLEIKFEYDMAQNAVRAIQQRKDALENLVRLHGQQYFAGPSVPRDLSKEREKQYKQKKADNIVGGKLTRSRTK